MSDPIDYKETIAFYADGWFDNPSYIRAQILDIIALIYRKDAFAVNADIKVAAEEIENQKS